MRRAGGGGGGGFFFLRGLFVFLPGFSSLYDAIHGWMTGRMDGKNFTTMTSFTICNIPTRHDLI
jgi:hypothetical protein